MFRGMGEKSAVAGLALLAASVLGGGASAADLGEGCCGDLEERVAELEATTARKGNRVVSLKISGVVHESLLIWDDGVESDAYVVTNAGYQSRLKFNGEAKINQNWSAGYEIELGIFATPSLAVDQTSDESVSSSPLAQDDSIFIRQNKFYIQSEQFGRLTVGQQSVAADNITSINVSNSLHIATPGHMIYMGAFRVRDADSGALSLFRYNDLMGNDGTDAPGDSDRLDAIRYDAKIGGFVLSASWGEDDYWDVAARYSGLLFGRMKTGAGIAYSTWTDAQDTSNGFSGGLNNGCHVVNGETDCAQVGLSASVLDIPTGLFVYGAYGVNWDDNSDLVAGADVEDNDEFWYLQAGIEKNWTGFGATTLFGEYGNYQSGFTRLGLAGPSAALPGGAIGSFQSAEVEMWGLGINQNFEAAALDVYAKYNHYSSSIDGGSQVLNPGTLGQQVIPIGDLEDFYTIYTGARIRF